MAPFDDAIARLQREVSLERLAAGRDVTLSKRGKMLTGVCPFHGRSKPTTFRIDTATNTWACTRCRVRAGTVVTFTMKVESISETHAVELLRSAPSVTPLWARSHVGRRVRRSTSLKMSLGLDPALDDAGLLRQVVDYYHRALLGSPEALAYLEQRRLLNADMVERFQLGFANRTLAYRIPTRQRKVGGELRGRLQRLGILRESGHEHLNGSVVVPIFDERGNVVQMYGRKVTPKLRLGTALHLYLPGEQRGIFNLAGVAASREVVLCGSIIDTLTWWCHGVQHVTAGFTEEHLNIFQRSGVNRVFLAHRRDDIGNKAADTIAAKLIGHDIECWRVLYPLGMDANDYALKATGDDDAFPTLLRRAEWIGKSEGPSMGTPVSASSALRPSSNGLGDLRAWMDRYLEALRVRNYSERTVENRYLYIGRFIRWCDARGLSRPQEISRPVLEAYQRHLFYFRRGGKPLTFNTQLQALTPVRGLFRWLTRQGVLHSNPASDLDLPRQERRLPRHVLSVEEVERVLEQPDVNDPLGLRDRAILEVLYSTGIRRMEAINLSIFDLDAERGTLKPGAVHEYDLAEPYIEVPGMAVIDIFYEREIEALMGEGQEAA